MAIKTTKIKIDKTGRTKKQKRADMAETLLLFGSKIL